MAEDMAKTLEQAETVLRIALEELAGAENIAYAGLPWNAVYKAFKELGMEAEPAVMEPYAKMVMAEGKRWQKAALQKLWGLLGISMPPWAYEYLGGDNWGVIWTTYFEKKTPQIRVGFPFKETLIFPLSKPHPSGFAIGTWPGGMEVNIKGLYARKGQAYLMADPVKDTRAILAGVRSLAPLFAFLGLADLEDALLVLRGLEEGEHQRKGAYFLAREGGTRVLFRGSLTGDPDLDGALLLGREVVLGTGEITLRLRTRVEVEMGGPRIRIEEGSLDWEGEVVPFASYPGVKFGLQERDVIIHLLRESLRTALKRTPPPSPRMRGLIEELLNGNLEALKAEDLPSRAYMRLLSHY